MHHECSARVRLSALTLVELVGDATHYCSARVRLSALTPVELTPVELTPVELNLFSR